MTVADDRTFYASMCVSLAVLLLAWCVAGLTKLSARFGIGAALAWPLAAGATARCLGIGVVSAIPALHSIRGPDEVTYLMQAREVVAGVPVLGGFPGGVPSNLHVWALIAQLRVLGGDSDLYLRIGFATFAVAGIGLASMAVAQMAGRRAGLIAAWILALEPSGVFFSGVLEKESLMYLADGLVLFGGARMMLKRDLAAAALIAGGCAIALLTRSYAGVALGVAGGLVVVHATMQRLPTRRARVWTTVLVVVLGLGALGAALPTIRSQAARLQVTQNANATDFSNLKLPPVDFSSARGLASGLPSRVAAVLFQPYPWRLANNSQRFGAGATLLAWGLLVTAAALALRRPRETMRRLAPFAYVFGLLLLVYALSAGNAGTGFRYRSHLLFALGAWCAVMAARPRTADVDADADAASPRHSVAPLAGTSPAA